MRITTLITTVCVALSPVALADNPQEQIKQSLAQAKKLVHLPNSRGIVGFGKNEAVVISDNPRWVVKGQFYDMWSNTKINSAIELQEAAKRIPLDKLAVNTKALLETRVNPEKSKTLTIFLDPFAKNTPNVVNVLTKYVTDHSLRFIYTATSNESVERLGAFTCQLSNQNSSQLFESMKNQRFIPSSKTCLQTKMMNSFGLSQFLHIKQSPTLIAPNDVFSTGMPHKIHTWLAENQD